MNKSDIINISQILSEFWILKDLKMNLYSILFFSINFYIDFIFVIILINIIS